jgi:rSAM/selenodomain-associated transferase 1
MRKHSSGRQRLAIVFVKAPRPGQVKTRLLNRLETDTVVAIYKSMTADVIETVRRTTAHVRICYYPAGDKKLVTDWLGNTFMYEQQVGPQLGERMKNAFSSAFADDYRRVVLVGTDIPDLSGNIIEEAFRGLDQQKPVIGPATDGGYYLIGFCRNGFLPQVFDDMPWGSNRVMENTLAVFDIMNRPVHVLPQCRDIDTHEDLMDFTRDISSAETRAKHTVSCLTSLGLMPGS